jgi:hypothetical protein
MPEVADQAPAAFPPLVEPGMPDALAGLDFDPTTLDPTNLTEPGKEPKKRKEAVEPEPATDEGKENAVKKEEKVPDTLDPKHLKEPSKREEPVNFKQLKELRRQAEEERDKFKAEVEAKNRELERLASLEAKTVAYEKEQEALRSQLKEREAREEHLQGTVRRISARETPEWQQTAGAIHAALAEVGKMLELPEVKEAGLPHSSLTLLDPNQKSALNDVLRVLTENGRLSEAQDLMEAHRTVNVFRGRLREIEARTVEEAKKWSENRDLLLTNSFREVKENISKVNPSLDPRSPEFQALPKENQDFVLSQYKEAEADALKIVEAANKPDVLAAGAFHNSLVTRLTSQALKGSQAQIEVLKKQIAELQGKLGSYEKAAGGDISGGSRAPATTGGDFENPDDLAKFLDPRNMAGYGGLNAGI